MTKLENNIELPSLGIAIPSCGSPRRQKTLWHMIKSILDQTVPFDEIIIFDNSGENILQEQSPFGKDPRITWRHSEKKLPISQSFDTAARSLGSTFITLQGDDDVLYPWFCESVKKAAAQKDVGVVYIPFDEMREDGKVIPRNPEKLSHKSYLSDKEFRSIFLSLGNILGSMALRRTVFLEAGGFTGFFRTGVYTDIILLLLCSAIGRNVALLDKTCFKYQIPEADWSGSVQKYSECLEGIRAVDTALQYLKENLMRHGIPEQDCFLPNYNHYKYFCNTFLDTSNNIPLQQYLLLLWACKNYSFRDKFWLVRKKLKIKLSLLNSHTKMRIHK